MIASTSHTKVDFWAWLQAHEVTRQAQRGSVPTYPQIYLVELMTSFSLSNRLTRQTPQVSLVHSSSRQHLKISIFHPETELLTWHEEMANSPKLSARLKQISWLKISWAVNKASCRFTTFFFAWFSKTANANFTFFKNESSQLMFQKFKFLKLLIQKYEPQNLHF